MKKTIIMLAAAVLCAVLMPAIFAAPATIRVIYYPADVVDAKTGTVNVQWDDGAGGVPGFTATLLYGVIPGQYTGTIPQSSAGNLSFIPVMEGVTGGVYYFRVSNDADSTWTNEYRLFIGKSTGLAVTDVLLSPNPFSPSLGGMNISYVPESDKNSNVKINITAYTMEGKRIRSIIKNGVRTVGASSTDTWDGRDDLGYMCKNGRYIIQIEIQDTTGTKQNLSTAVMVK